MLNLLFITSSPNGTAVKDIVQPLVKARVDVVADFDHGLKDVFEKRPAIVVIQDQISGVAGESVARHIQMLLGSGAPKFVLLHENSAKAKPIKGLFDHLVDLTLSKERLAEELLTALKDILGEQWDKVAIPRRKDIAAIAAAVSGSKEQREVADKLVDDFLSDLGAVEAPAEEPVATPKDIVAKVEDAAKTADDIRHETMVDEMASLLVEAAKEAKTKDARAKNKKEAAADIAPIESASGQPELPPAAATSRRTKTSTRKAPQSTNGDVSSPSVTEPEPGPATVSRVEVVQVKPAPAPAAEAPPQNAQAEPAQVLSEPAAPVSTVSPAEFRVPDPSGHQAEQVPEDLLLAFEENYRSHRHNWGSLFIGAVVITALCGGAWYLFTQKPALLAHNSAPAKPVATEPIKPGPVKPAPLPVVAAQSAPSTDKPKADVQPAPLPSFVSPQARDTSFSQRKPGWERYADKAHDVRIYRSGKQIKAVQVLAARGTTIQAPFLQSALQELAGSKDYKVTSREQKHGYLLQRASVGKTADLLMYRKKGSDAVVAFVISIN